MSVKEVRGPLLVAALVAALASCRDEPGERAPSSSDPTRVVIRKGPDGKTMVEGAPTMKGDAVSCAAMNACCVAPQSDVFCAMAQTQPGADCASVAATGKRWFAERKVAMPAGCP